MSTNFLSTYRRHQDWTIPDSVIYYISKNPSSPKAYQKLAQSCKYFFWKNPIIVAKQLYCSMDIVSIAFSKYFQTEIDLAKTTSKIWITDEFENTCLHTDAKVISRSIVPKLYQIDVTTILIYKQVIPLKDFLFIASKVENITLRRTIIYTVKDKSWSVVPFEKLVEILPKVKEIRFYDNSNVPSIMTSTVEKLIELPHFSKIDYFCLARIPESFDIETFFSHILKNQCTRFYLNFCDSISDAYKNRLDTIIDEILAIVNHEYKIPLIKFREQNEEKMMKMRNLYYR